MKSPKTFVAVFIGLLASGGCADSMTWQRADGRPVGESFRWAAAECRERAREYGGDATDVMQRCMRRYGYVWGQEY